MPLSSSFAQNVGPGGTKALKDAKCNDLEAAISSFFQRKKNREREREREAAIRG
jgi:hypothetical protein